MEKIQIIEDSVFKQLEKLDKELSKVLETLKDIVKEGSKITLNIKTAKDVQALSDAAQKAEQNANKLTIQQNQILKLQKQIEIQEAKLAAAYLTAAQKAEKATNDKIKAEEKAIKLAEKAAAAERKKAEANNYASDSIKALRERNSLLRKEMDKLSLSTKEGREQMARYRAEIDRNTRAINENTDADRKRISNIGKYKQAFQSAIATMSGWGAVIVGVYQSLKSVIDTRAQFEKFEAVLTNALGSKSRAVEGMKMITDFASKTPFAIDELTDSYVKLVNRGFIPTKIEMERLGDLASSTGKSFDQLVEALLDAQTGEFERLKEFGITSKKQGDNVTFTFKGVQTQVKATDEQIKKYILSLGDLQGVSGSMAAISETLGGKISNLGDKWTQLLNTTGEESKGFFSMVISGLTSILDFAEKMISSGKVTALIKTVIFGPLYGIYEETKKMVSETRTLLEDWGWIEKKKEETKKTNELTKAEKELLDARYKNTVVSNMAESSASAAFAKYKKREEEKGFFEQEHKVQTKEEKEAVEKAEKDKQEKIKETQKIKEAELKKGYDIAIKLIEQEKENNREYNEWLLNEEKKKADAKAKQVEIDKENAKLLNEFYQESNTVNEEDIEKKAEKVLEKAREVNETLAMFGEARLSNLEQERARELKLAGDNKEKQAKINEKYDKEEAKVKRRQAIREKAMAIFELGILLATQIARQQWFKVAITTAQITALAIKKIPEFAKGVIDFKGGEAIVGEKGREILLDRTGKAYLSPDQATLTSLPQGASVIPNNETEKILAQLPVHQQRVREFKPQENMLILELLKSNKRLENVIKRKKFVGININEKGFTSFMQQENSKTNIYSSYFRSNV